LIFAGFSAGLFEPPPLPVWLPVWEVSFLLGMCLASSSLVFHSRGRYLDVLRVPGGVDHFDTTLRGSEGGAGTVILAGFCAGLLPPLLSWPLFGSLPSLFDMRSPPTLGSGD
jgi:hypothetical protein